MPEVITVKLGNAEEFDKAVREGLPEGCDLQFISKDAATKGGRAGIVITFSVEVNGRIHRAQAVTTLPCLRAAVAVLNGRYDDDSKLREHLKV